MKTKVLLSLGLGIAMCSAAWATPPTDPGTIGNIDGVLHFCQDVDPRSASSYRALRAMLVGAQSESARDALQASAEYQQARQFMQFLLGREPADWALQKCRDILPGSGSGTSNTDR
jgi:hypothetical protein